MKLHEQAKPLYFTFFRIFLCCFFAIHRANEGSKSNDLVGTLYSWSGGGWIEIPLIAFYGALVTWKRRTLEMNTLI